MIPDCLGNIILEANVVAVVTVIFLCLFVVAGVRQIMKDKESER